MIIEYHRPTTVAEALSLLARKQPLSYPLGGGTVLNRNSDEHIAVVDVQALGLDTLGKKGNILQVGATVTLQRLLELSGLAKDINRAITHEATLNLRQMATIAGKLVTADGRSPFATAMLALDVSLEVLELDAKPKKVRFGDWLPIRHNFMPGRLISKVSIPLNVRIAYEYISRTPADLPIVCAAVAFWESGRTRLALGGWGLHPCLAMDGPDLNGIEIAASSAYSIAEDEWASAAYRKEMASVLSTRCVNRINSDHS
jgi:CO/xanthine dehydrogenase FAD-binding subunit